MPAKPLCVSTGSLVVLLGSSEDMGDPGKSSSAGKLPPQEQCFTATENSHTSIVSPGSPSPSFSKMIRAAPIKIMLVKVVGLSIISSQQDFSVNFLYIASTVSFTVMVLLTQNCCTIVL